MLVCGILKGLNEILQKKKLESVQLGNVNEIDIIPFKDFDILDPELF